ncbi:MAG TPA: TetR/AcrR family transcriptional regulator [Acidimicrobiales bacterium]|nr:TetR/AcrR family transcriptional regulator [Acidimicrobiales bacterium]
MSLADRVLDATYAEVAELGLAGLTVEAVAQRAGSSRATLYRHFPGGREELVERTIRREVARFFETVLGQIPPAPPAGGLADHLTGLVQAAHRELQAHDVLQRLLLDEAEAIMPPLAMVQPLVARSVVAHLRGALDGARLAGKLRSGVDLPAAAEHVARLILSYAGSPGRWDLTDPAEADRLVRTTILAGLGV